MMQVGAGLWHTPGMTKRPKRPRDPMQLAKLSGYCDGASQDTPVASNQRGSPQGWMKGGKRAGKNYRLPSGRRSQERQRGHGGNLDKPLLF